MTCCCIIGCDQPAVEWAALNVPYCHRHAESHRQATAAYLRQLNGFGRRISLPQSEPSREEEGGPS